MGQQRHKPRVPTHIPRIRLPDQIRLNENIPIHVPVHVFPQPKRNEPTGQHQIYRQLHKVYYPHKPHPKLLGVPKNNVAQINVAPLRHNGLHPLFRRVQHPQLQHVPTKDNYLPAVIFPKNKNPTDYTLSLAFPSDFYFGYASYEKSDGVWRILAPKSKPPLEPKLPPTLRLRPYGSKVIEHFVT